MDELASIWPAGGLFAFSGVDGETVHGEPFVAAGTASGFGWRLWLTPRLEFTARVGGVQVESLGEPSGFCFTDCWSFPAAAGGKTCTVNGAFLNRASFVTAVTMDPPGDAAIELSAEGLPHHETDGARVYEGEGWWVAVSSSQVESGAVFAVAISYASEEEAVARSKSALETDIEQTIAERFRFYRSIVAPDSVWGTKRRAFYKAAGIMKVNVESAQQDIPYRWTTPDRMPHRHMWLWDSAFHALGLQYLRTDLAQDAIRALLSKQRQDGKLNLAVWPGKSESEEQDTQPPIVAWAVWMLFDRSESQQFLAEVYPALVRYIEWFEKNRKLDNGLYGWQIRVGNDAISGARGGESGMDNSPRFDRATAMTAIDLCSYMAGEYQALTRMARVLGHSQEADEWRKRRFAIAERTNELLWDEEDRFYYDLDEEGRFIPVKTPAGLMPLHARIADRDQAEALRTHLTASHEFWTTTPLASVSKDEDQYCQDMWRGPAWMNINVLVYHALQEYAFREEAHNLAHRCMDEMARWYIHTGCLYEYYDSQGAIPPSELPRKGAPGAEGGAGFGVIADYNWTAAAYIHFAHQLA